MMRVHSVYHNNDQLYEKYKDLIGGLNKMTIAKAKQIIQNKSNQNNGINSSESTTSGQ